MNINKFMRRKNGSSKGPKDTKKLPWKRIERLLFIFIDVLNMKRKFLEISF